MTAQTVCRPRSIGPVSQQPLRKKPVIGAVEQTSSARPRTLIEGSCILASLGDHGKQQEDGEKNQMHRPLQDGRPAGAKRQGADEQRQN